jgi:glycosyltransferase involved in cell wall biosynthesis
MLKRFDGWIVTGLYTQKWLERHIRNDRPIVLIPPAIARVKKKEAPAAPPFRALIAANLIPVKGLIPLMRELDKQRPRNLQILLLGDPRLDPDYARKLQERVKTSAYLSKTITIGKAVSQAGLMRHLSQSHLLISASRFESFGMAVHEALCSGVPVWALPTGNIAQISHPLLHTFGSLSRLVESLKRISNKLSEQGVSVTTEKSDGWKDAAKLLKAFLQTDDRFES